MSILITARPRDIFRRRNQTYTSGLLNKEAPSYKGLCNEEAKRKKTRGFCTNPKWACGKPYKLKEVGLAFLPMADKDGYCSNCGYALFYSQNYLTPQMLNWLERCNLARKRAGLRLMTEKDLYSIAYSFDALGSFSLHSV